MKRLLTGVVIVIALVFGAWVAVHQVFRGGESYYTRISTSGKRETLKDDQGKSIIDYSYHQKGYNSNGEAVKLDFYGNKTRPLRLNAYLKVTVRNGDVRSWEQVDRSKVPSKALGKLE